MSDKKSKKHKRLGKTVASVYVSKLFCYVGIALVFAIIALVAVMPKACEYVHKVEANLPKRVADIEIQSGNEYTELRKAYYGALVGKITSEDFGLNCKLYGGANDASMKYGAGMSLQKDFFNGFTYIKGYGETFFAPLHFAKPGDIINVETSDFAAPYKVISAQYIDKNKANYDSNNTNVIVLCAEESLLSPHSDKEFCVIAELDREVG